MFIKIGEEASAYDVPVFSKVCYGSTQLAHLEHLRPFSYRVKNIIRYVTN